MKHILSIKGGIALAAVVVILAVGAAYAANLVFDKSVTGRVRFLVSGDDLIQVFEADGTTVVNEIDFGTVIVNPSGQGPTPSHQVVVRNLSDARVEVVVTGDGGDDLLPMFGPTTSDLMPAPDNAFTLEPRGQTGDGFTGWVGLISLVPPSGDKVTTIIFRATEVPGPPPAKIAFTSDRDGNFEIHTMDPDGSNLVNLTNNPFTDGGPSWSPGSHTIAFGSNRDANDEIYIMSADGSNQTRLTNNGAFDVGSTWSPDGNKIAFASDRDGDFEIYVMDADGSNPTNLTQNPLVDEIGPAWSPDGSKIAFKRQGEIYVMDADGLNPISLTSGASNTDSSPTWSPDGTRIAFVSRRDNNEEIYVMSADGSNPTRLTNNTVFESSPAWSPDGSEIVFTSRRDLNSEIYVMSADGSNPTRLTAHPASDSSPHWCCPVALPPPPPLALDVYVLSGGNATGDQAVLDALTGAGHNANLGPQPHEWDGTQADLTVFDVVVLLNNYNRSLGSMPATGEAALLARIHRRTPMDGVRKAEGG